MLAERGVEYKCLCRGALLSSMICIIRPPCSCGSTATSVACIVGAGACTVQPERSAPATVVGEVPRTQPRTEQLLVVVLHYYSTSTSTTSSSTTTTTTTTTTTSTRTNNS